jgi:xanthine dehydrogenase YagT iron-sulfur-binding subunit
MTDNSHSSKPSGFNRRTFIAGAAAGTAVAPLTARSGGAATSVGAAPDASMSVDVSLQINGTEKQLTIDPRTTLLDALREHVALTGSKKGCDHGQCGACTMLVDDRRIVMPDTRARR